MKEFKESIVLKIVFCALFVIASPPLEAMIDDDAPQTTRQTPQGSNPGGVMGGLLGVLGQGALTPMLGEQGARVAREVLEHVNPIEIMEDINRERERVSEGEIRHSSYAARLRRAIGDLERGVENGGLDVLELTLKDGRKQGFCRDDVVELSGMLAEAEIIENRTRNRQAVYDNVQNFVLDGANELREAAKRQHEARIERDRIREEGRMNIMKWSEISNQVTTFLSDGGNLKKIGALVGGIIVTYFVAKHGSKVAAKQVEKILDRTPPIIKETSRRSLYEKLMGKKVAEPVLLDEVIADPILRARLRNIADDTKNAKRNGDYLSNALLYGPPGTGKTMFGKALSHYTGEGAASEKMDYALIPGSSFAKLPTDQALAALWDVLEWGRRSKNGTIIIIDEVETFLSDRATVGMEQRLLITEFLAQIEKPIDKKVMFLFITNRPKDLDVAVLSRIGTFVHIPRPEQEQLAELIALYASKVYERMLTLDDDFANHYSELAAIAYEGGLVGRNIEQLFKSDIVKEARRRGTSVIDAVMVKETLQNFIAAKRERDAFVLEGSADALV